MILDPLEGYEWEDVYRKYSQAETKNRNIAYLCIRCDCGGIYSSKIENDHPICWFCGTNALLKGSKETESWQDSQDLENSLLSPLDGEALI